MLLVINPSDQRSIGLGYDDVVAANISPEFSLDF
jgi:hypothetical protein